MLWNEMLRGVEGGRSGNTSPGSAVSQERLVRSLLVVGTHHVLQSSRSEEERKPI